MITVYFLSKDSEKLEAAVSSLYFRSKRGPGLWSSPFVGILGAALLRALVASTR